MDEDRIIYIDYLDVCWYFCWLLLLFQWANIVLIKFIHRIWGWVWEFRSCNSWIPIEKEYYQNSTKLLSSNPSTKLFYNNNICLILIFFKKNLCNTLHSTLLSGGPNLIRVFSKLSIYHLMRLSKSKKTGVCCWPLKTWWIKGILHQNLRLWKRLSSSPKIGLIVITRKISVGISRKRSWESS